MGKQKLKGDAVPVDWTTERIAWLKRTQKRMRDWGKVKGWGNRADKVQVQRKGIMLNDTTVISFTNGGLLIEDNERPLFNYFVVGYLPYSTVKAMRNGTTVSWRYVIS